MSAFRPRRKPRAASSPRRAGAAHRHPSPGTAPSGRVQPNARRPVRRWKRSSRCSALCRTECRCTRPSSRRPAAEAAAARTQVPPAAPPSPAQHQTGAPNAPARPPSTCLRSAPRTSGASDECPSCSPTADECLFPCAAGRRVSDGRDGGAPGDAAPESAHPHPTECLSRPAPPAFSHRSG